MAKRILLLGAVLCFFWVGSLWADEWILDPLHSKIEFTADSRLVRADGQFHKFTVKADVDDKQLEKSKVTIVVDVASIDTANERRDNHLRTKDFFDVETHPQATIEVKSLRKLSPTEYEASAEVKLHGVAKSLTLPMEILAFEGGVLHFRGASQISRKDFGIGTDTTGSVVNVANPIRDLVAIRYEMDLRKVSPAAGPASGTAPSVR